MDSHIRREIDPGEEREGGLRAGMNWIGWRNRGGSCRWSIIYWWWQNMNVFRVGMRRTSSMSRTENGGLARSKNIHPTFCPSRLTLIAFPLHRRGSLPRSLWFDSRPWNQSMRRTIAIILSGKQAENSQSLNHSGRDTPKRISLCSCNFIYYFAIAGSRCALFANFGPRVFPLPSRARPNGEKCIQQLNCVQWFDERGPRCRNNFIRNDQNTCQFTRI